MISMQLLWPKTFIYISYRDQRELYSVALAQSNLEKAEDLLMSVSHPASSNFPKHWTAKDVAQKFAPSTEAISSVAAWIRDSGIEIERIFRSHSGGWLQLNATVKEAEQLLNTTYYIYQNVQTGESRAACDEHSVSSSIQHHIDFVMPTIHFSLQAQQGTTIPRSVAAFKEDQSALAAAASSAGSSTSVTTNCAQETTLDCVRALYNIPVGNTSNSANSLGVVEFTWAAYFQDDLNAFFQYFMPEAVGNAPAFESVNGGYLQNISEQFSFNGETSLDLEYTMTLAYPQNVTLYEVGDLWVHADMNNFLAALDDSYCGALDSTFDPVYPDPIVSPIPGWPGGYNSSDCGNHTPTKVITVSYAWYEAVYSPAYLQRQCYEYLKLGLQGVTVLFASGDYGVAGTEGFASTQTPATSSPPRSENSTQSSLPPVHG
jgi:tripeptidyl-peptidase I